MSEAERWVHLQETLLLLAGLLRRAPDGTRLLALPPPISRCIEQRCDEMLRRWLPDPTQPLPGGEVQAAALARVQAAMMFAARAQEAGYPPAPRGEYESTVENLLVDKQSGLAGVWLKYGKES